MSLNLDNFLHSLATAIASACSLSYGAASAVAKRSLFRHGAVEEFALSPYTVLRIYPGSGPTRFVEPGRVSLQVATTGKPAAALNQARKVFEQFLDAGGSGSGSGRTNWTINGLVADAATADGTWRIIACDAVQTPGLAGADEQGNVDVVFNVDVEFVKAS
jgi:hypothetical protein